jgi:hypothetical protein
MGGPRACGLGYGSAALRAGLDSFGPSTLRWLFSLFSR